MKKEKIKNILLIVIVALVTSFVTAYGVSSTFANVLTSMPSVTVPSGYTLVSHVYLEISGFMGLSGIFDNNGNATKTSSINGFLFNSSNNNCASGQKISINIISLWKKS